MKKEIERLVSTNELKTNHLKKIASGEIEPSASVTHNQLAGETLILMIGKAVETVVHPIAEGISLVYTADGFEIVGLQIEGFDT